MDAFLGRAMATHDAIDSLPVHQLSQHRQHDICIHALPHSWCVSDSAGCSEAQFAMADSTLTDSFRRSSFIPQAYRLTGEGVRASLSGCVLEVTRNINTIPQAHRLAGIGVRASLSGCVNKVTRHIIRLRMVWLSVCNTPGPGIARSLASP